MRRGDLNGRDGHFGREDLKPLDDFTDGVHVSVYSFLYRSIM